MASILRFLAIAVLVAPASGLCSIPVFRYALERWPAAPYEAILFHRGPLAAEHEAVLSGIRESSANVMVEKADLEGKPDAAVQEIWKAQGNPALPWLALRFPQSEPAMPSAWAGPPDAARVRALLDSPARREIAQRIILGESAVWLILECGDAARDGAAAKLLGAELAALEKTLKLPEEDAGAMPLLSDVPLRIAFSVLRLSRRDPAEKEFVAMLARSGGALAEGKGPVALPVFGRGRALWPLEGERLSAPEIAEAAEFLAGACSCQVKEMNPGLDLLFDAPWENLLSEPAEKKAGPPPPAAPSKPEARPGPASRTSPAWSLPWTGIAALAILVLAAGALLLRPRKPAGRC